MHVSTYVSMYVSMYVHIDLCVCVCVCVCVQIYVGQQHRERTIAKKKPPDRLQSAPFGYCQAKDPCWQAAEAQTSSFPTPVPRQRAAPPASFKFHSSNAQHVRVLSCVFGCSAPRNALQHELC